MPVELCTLIFYFNDIDEYQYFMDAPNPSAHLRPQASLYISCNNKTYSLRFYDRWFAKWN